MAPSEPLNTHYRNQYEALLPDLPGSGLPWLKTRRNQALARFNHHGFPSPREEEWRYTNVAAIERRLFTPCPRVSRSIDPEWLAQYQLPDAQVLVFVDGYWDPGLSSPMQDLPEAIVVSSLAEALARNPESVETALSQVLGDEAHGFLAFNTAFFTDGAWIEVAAKQTLEQPIQLLFVATQADSLTTIRNLIQLQPGAQAQLIETFVGLDDAAYLTAAVTEIQIADHASLDYTRLQVESGKAFHFGGTYIKQAPYARLNHNSFSFGGVLVRNEVHTQLSKAAESHLNGLYLASGRQHVDNHTRIEHSEPHAISREQYKGILDQRARGVFQGRVVVAEDAQKTDSDMQNRNLLLSDKAEVDTKPQLEIYADDVKCAHGVTVGQLSENSVFYLRSRGIDAETARNMLTFAFANEMVGKIAVPALRDCVQAELLKQLPQAGIREEWL